MRFFFNLFCILFLTGKMSKVRQEIWKAGKEHSPVCSHFDSGFATLGETTTSPSLEGVACEDAMDCPSRLLRSFYSSQYLRVCGALSVSRRGGPLVVSRLSVRVVGRQIPRQQLSQYIHRNSPTEPQCKPGGHRSF